MALTKKPAVNETTTAQFEEMEDGAVEQTVETVAEQKATPTAEDKAKVSATVAVAAAKTSVAVATSNSRLSKALDNLKTDGPVADWGEVTRITTSAGGKFVDDKKVKVGSEIEITIQCWNDNFVVSPGEDGDEATKLVRYSTDGIHLTDGGLVADYLERLRTVESYKNASVKHYLQIFASFDKSDVETEHLDTLIELSISPSSKKSFGRYTLNQQFKVNKGLISADDVARVKVTVADASYGGNDYVYMEFSPVTA